MRQPRFRVLAWFLAVAVVVCSLRVSAAWAQAAPPDLIRMKSGGMLRGTIIELVPGKTVTFVGVDGQTRKLPMSDVAFAGPSANDPLAAPAPAAPPAPAALAAPLVAPALRLRATEPNITYYVKSSTSHGFGMGYAFRGPAFVGVTINNFDRLCTAPCQTSLEPGNWVLGISRDEGRILAARPLTLQGDEQLTASYVSRRSTRVGFLVTGAVLLAVGLGLFFHAVGRCDGTDTYYTNPNCGDTELAIGTGSLLAGGVLMIVPIFIRDYAEIVASP